MKTDELFAAETRHSFFKRVQTNVSVSISKTVFYVSNVQEPIARQAEIVFRTLLFTIVVLEVFGLLFLIIKLVIVPLSQIIIARVRTYFLSKKISDGNVVINLPMKNGSTSDDQSATVDNFNADGQQSLP